MGSIFKPKYKNKNGEYVESNVYWIKYYRNGKPYRESAKSKKETDAKHLLKRREGEIANGKIPGIYFDKVTFEDLEEIFLRDRRLNRGKASAEEAEMRLINLRPYFEGFKVPNITSPKINAYIETRLEEDAKPATINRELAALRRMMNLGARQTPPVVDRVPYLPMLEEDNVKEGFFESEDYVALLKALPAHIRPVATFAYHTGWRKEEIVGLTWKRVNLKEGTVELKTNETKNRSCRFIYLETELIKQLKFQKLRTPKGCDLVFHKNGRRIKDFRCIWNRACRETKLGYGYKISKKYIEKWQVQFNEGPTLHNFRRTAVRNMDRAGISRRVAMTRTGHKTESVYNRYNIVNDEDLKRAAQTMNEYNKPADGQRFGQSR